MASETYQKSREEGNRLVSSLNVGKGMYKVSVIVPVYGVERYIERCSRSLFEQTYQNLEFVFVDDFSPDRSIEVLKKVVEAYPERKDFVRIVKHERNRGASASRNTGLANSKGEFVFYVDSDDWIELDAVELLVKAQLLCDSDIVYGKYLIYENEDPRLLKAKDYSDKEGFVLQMMQRTWDHFLAGRLIRRSLFVTNNLFCKEGLNVAEDRYIMTMLAYYALGFGSVEQVVYNYERRNTDAATNTKNAKRVLRNQRQELGNVLLLEEFFKDKEAIYQEACSRCVMEEIDRSLQLAIKHFAKDEFYEVVSIIDARSDTDLQLIGWEKNGVKGWINRRFAYKVLSRAVNRAIRYINKRVKRVLGRLTRAF